MTTRQIVAGTGKGYLDGHFLIAMPGMADERFAKSIIYVCAHSADGAMGIAVNQPARHLSFRDLLVQLEIVPESSTIRLPAPAQRMQVHRGGPVETGRGFVLHSGEYFVADSTLPIDKNVSLTATIDVLRAIATGDGPKRAILALGYAGWAAGQLEEEILANGWLSCPADPALIFDPDPKTKYDRVLASLGVSAAALSSTAGHA